ncbi:MAG: sulfurtransferase [Alphaproteobacteria bacterium]|nr:sulfurtransferase [Alphaproteobacteria bacterium]
MDIAARGYANPDLLWSPETLRERIGHPGLTIIDTRPAEAFAKGRIPGARHFDLYFVNTDDTDPAPLDSFTRMWANLLGWRGVRETDTIVFYGEFTDMCAARGFWFAEYLGHADVHVLDGGIAAWSAAGLAVDTEGDPPRPVKFAFAAAPERVATYSSILDALDNPDCVIIDNRSRAEFVGTKRLARHGGAIPGAKHRDWEDLYDHDSGCMNSADQLREAFETLDATPDNEITLYCNTGYRSAHAYLALRLLDYPRIRNYVGSWQEWGNRDGLPIWNPA